jgi:hypothetical protein
MYINPMGVITKGRTLTYLYLIIKDVRFPSSTTFFRPICPFTKSHNTHNCHHVYDRSVCLYPNRTVYAGGDSPFVGILTGPSMREEIGKDPRPWDLPPSSPHIYPQVSSNSRSNQTMVFREPRLLKYFRVQTIRPLAATDLCPHYMMVSCWIGGGSGQRRLSELSARRQWTRLRKRRRR